MARRPLHGSTARPPTTRSCPPTRQAVGRPRPDRSRAPPAHRVGAMSAREDLLKLIADIAVVHGKVILSSGREADYYVDLRRVTLHKTAAPLIGEVMLELTSDW